MTMSMDCQDYAGLMDYVTNGSQATESFTASGVERQLRCLGCLASGKPH